MYGLTGSLIARLLPDTILYTVVILQQLRKILDSDTWVCFMLCFCMGGKDGVYIHLGRDLFLDACGGYTLVAITRLANTY